MKRLFIHPGELAARVEYNEDHCTINFRADVTLLEREFGGASDQQIAAACLQATINERAIFPCENPRFSLPPRGAFVDWEFSVRFRALIPPFLEGEVVAEDFVRSLHEDDLVSVERCKERLILRIQSQIRPTLPESYLKSMATPVDAIEVWSRELALAALGDMRYPGADPNRPRNERVERAIAWVLDNSVAKALAREPMVG